MDGNLRKNSITRRFAFGKNWWNFLSTLDEERIQEAERSLLEMLESSDLKGRSFLDAGSGSGLFSLAARRLGARVHSFDSDPRSVACARELRERYFPEDGQWRIEGGSVLDAAYLRSLPAFDVVYCWGVLHHTGDMWRGLENTLLPLRRGGRLFVALYNDQGLLSDFWRRVKRTYCSGSAGRALVLATAIPLLTLQGLAIGILKHRRLLGHFRRYRKKRGMSVFHDWVDWLGGYPFEVAKPEAVSEFLGERGFELRRLVATKRYGCNQYLFVRNRERPDPS